MGRLLSARKLLLLALNLASTVLTLFTGLRENPLIVLISGRYDLIRARLTEGLINYNIVRDDIVFKEKLADLTEVGKSYRFISAPRRTPANLGIDRSTCMRVNSINSTVMNLHFDDFWGYGPRRTQVFLFSISAPHCDVINFTPQWYNDACVTTIGGGSEAACGRYILDNFARLYDNRTIQASAEADFGKPGMPFLKCRGRPERPFHYITDLMVHQSYWAGGSYHVEVQSSRCVAFPVVRDSEWRTSLFKVRSVDKAADVVMGIDNTSWFVTIVSFAYGIVTVCMIVNGIFAAIVRSRHVLYVPSAARFLHEWRIFKVLLPFMNVATNIPLDEHRVVAFKGVAFMASDVWLNHWLYIVLSMLDAVSTVRATYVVFQMGTWMLSNVTNTENFVFTCSALTKITWIICLVHTLLRLGCKLALNSFKKFKIIRSSVRAKLDWYVDAVAMLTSYKIYSILLCVVLYLMLQLRKTTTLMKRQMPYKRGVYGGDPHIAQFWGSELVCDMVVIVSIVLSSGVVLSSLLLCTKYVHTTHNRLLRLLQRRYVIVGWDVYVALEALGMDPYNRELVDSNGVCKTSCSLGAVLQQLYTSGMSGHVKLAGDHVFSETGAFKDEPKLRYSLRQAVKMGLVDKKRTASGVSIKYMVNSTESTDLVTSHKEFPSSHVSPEETAPAASMALVKSVFDRTLRVVTDGYFGKLVLVDEDEPGHMVKSATSAAMEFEVHELLTTLSPMDIKHLLGNDKKLHMK